MSDSTGIFQHASFTVPNFAQGYCTDDNARALVLALMLQQLGPGSPQLGAQVATYAVFLNHAFDRPRGAVQSVHRAASRSERITEGRAAARSRTHYSLRHERLRDQLCHGFSG